MKTNSIAGLCTYLIASAVVGASAATLGCGFSVCGYADCENATDGPVEPEDGDPPTYGYWQMTCMNLNEEDYNWWWTQGDSEHVPNQISVCAHWSEGDGPTTGYEETWDQIVRAECSAKCVVVANDADVPQTHSGDKECEDAQWSSVAKTSGLWTECTPETLELDLELIEDLIDHSTAVAVADLPCNLATTCIDYLDIEARAGLLTMSGEDAAVTAEIAVETVTGPGASSSVEFGSGGTVVTGEAAYTAVACGEDACPFYLAHLTLSQSSSWWTSVPFIGFAGPTVLTKQASAVELSLRQPTLGIWVPSSGWVIFPPGSLILQGEAVIGGTSNTYSENGPYEGVVTNDEYVFGLVTFGTGGASTLLIGSSGTNIFGSWGVMGDFATP